MSPVLGVELARLRARPCRRQPQQLCRVYFQCLGELPDDLQAHIRTIRAGSLNTGQIRSVHTCLERQLLLRPALISAKAAQVRGEGAPQVHVGKASLLAALRSPAYRQQSSVLAVYTARPSTASIPRARPWSTSLISSLGVPTHEVVRRGVPDLPGTAPAYY